MDFDSLSNSRLGIGLALGISRALPRPASGPFVRAVARRLANPSLAIAQASRLNQWMASGRTLAGAALDEAVERNLEMLGRFLYDLYHVPGGEKALMRRVVVTDAFARVTEAADRPIVFAACHLGNFDLVGRALAYGGQRTQVLSVPDPNGGYQWQNEQRRRAGMDMTPVSVEALKKAARRLASGGSVMTGLDRPLPGVPEDERPRFFGEPAPLPLLHIRLAIKAKAPVVVLSALMRPDGLYEVQASEPLPMEGTDVLFNAERALRITEELIARDPAQWAMPHRVWPDLPIPA